MDQMLNGYEEPVDHLCQAIQELGQLDLVWDRKDLHPGTRLDLFLVSASTSDLFVVCHSKRYWTRPYCMFELSKCVYAFLEHASRHMPLLVFVRLQGCQALDDVAEVLKGHIEAWHTNSPEIKIAADLLKPSEVEPFRREVVTMLEQHLIKMLQTAGVRFNGALDTHNGKEVAQWILNTHASRTPRKR